MSLSSGRLPVNRLPGRSSRSPFPVVHVGDVISEEHYAYLLRESGRASARSPRLEGSLAQRARSAPPSLSGGIDSHEGSQLSVHWVQGTVPHERAEALAAWVTEWLGVDPERRDWGRYRYDGHLSWGETGVALYVDSSPERAGQVHRGRATLAVPGSVLDSFSQADVGAFLAHLVKGYWFLCTRVDVAWDDGSRGVTPGQLEAEAERGNFTGFRVFKRDAPRRRVGASAELEGDMITFGRRGRDGKGAYLRVYDKCLESEGENKCIRWEVEFSGERARKVFGRLAGASGPADLAVACGCFIGGAIDFVDRSSGDKNLARLPRLPWWSAVVRIIGRTVLRSARSMPTIEGAKRWLMSSVSPTLGMLRQAFGAREWEAWLEALLDTGESRMGYRHRSILALFRGSGSHVQELNGGI